MSVVEIYDAAQQFDMSDVLQRYAEKTRYPADVVAEHHREILRFLTLCATSSTNIGMRGPLDELWHTFIIFTEKYQRFCSTLGVPFIHHYPDTREDKNYPDVFEAYNNFLKEYERCFGEEPPRHVWPRPLDMNVDDPGCDKCGNHCSQKCWA